MKLNTTSLRNGTMEKGSSALQRLGDEFYSYRTKIAFLDFENGATLYLDPVGYSVTTKKQKRLLEKFYASKGYRIVRNWNEYESV